jgi:hypothetical protein
MTAIRRNSLSPESKKQYVIAGAEIGSVHRVCPSFPEYTLLDHCLHVVVESCYRFDPFNADLKLVETIE